MRRSPIALSSVLGALTFNACVSMGPVAPAGPEQHEARSIELDKSERVRVELKMPFGELEVGAGAGKLLQADFTYNVAAWKPELRYSSSGNAGDLVIEQKGVGASTHNAKNRWDLRFHEQVPLDFRTELGAGEAKLNLGSLTLSSADIRVGAGQLRLDLRGKPRKDYSVHIRGGVGEATIYLPKDAGISATVSGGLGDVSVSGLQKSGERYINEAWEKAGARIRLDIQGGVGSVKLVAE